MGFSCWLPLWVFAWSDWIMVSGWSHRWAGIHGMPHLSLSLFLTSFSLTLLIVRCRNSFHCNVSQTLIHDTATLMVSLGLADVGYNYVNIDDCWQSWRNASGVIQPDNVTFPDGYDLAFLSFFFFVVRIPDSITLFLSISFWSWITGSHPSWIMFIP